MTHPFAWVGGTIERDPVRDGASGDCARQPRVGTGAGPDGPGQTMPGAPIAIGHLSRAHLPRVPLAVKENEAGCSDARAAPDGPGRAVSEAWEQQTRTVRARDVPPLNACRVADRAKGSQFLQRTCRSGVAEHAPLPVRRARD